MNLLHQTENPQRRGSRHLVWFLLHKEIKPNVSVFVMMRARGILQPHNPGHLKRKKLECQEAHWRRVCFPAELWSKRKRVGRRCGCCTAVHPHNLHLGLGGGTSTDLWIPKMSATWGKEALDRKRSRGSSVAPYYSILLPIENDFTTTARCLLRIPKDEETVLLPYYRLQEHLDSIAEWGKPLNNCANTGWSSVRWAWLQMFAVMFW